MADSKRAPRRRHSDDLKRRVLAECAQPGASLARIALAHSLNANLVHKWRRAAQRSRAVVAPTRQADSFIPVALAAGPTALGGDIRIQLRRGALAVNLTWPVGAAAHCAAWVREVLR